jgi:ADP-heptose:LPS heptosyltransferase
MFDNLFYKLGLKYCKFRFRKKRDSIQNFTNFIQDGTRILIILPNDPKQFDDAKDVIINLHNNWNNIIFTIIARSQYSAYNEFRDFFQTYGISTSDINRFNLPKKSIKEEVLRNQYDITIDLNIELHLPSVYLSKATDAKFRIGIKKELADFFYNFQFDPVDYTNYKNVYNNLFKNLRMFSNLGEKNEIQNR